MSPHLLQICVIMHTNTSCACLRWYMLSKLAKQNACDAVSTLYCMACRRAFLHFVLLPGLRYAPVAFQRTVLQDRAPSLLDMLDSSTTSGLSDKYAAHIPPCAVHTPSFGAGMCMATTVNKLSQSLTSLLLLLVLSLLSYYLLKFIIIIIIVIVITHPI